MFVLPHDMFVALQTLLALLRENDDKTLLFLLLIEEAGIPLPLPGDLLIAFQGYRSSIGEANVVEAGITAILAVQLGSTILYLVSRRLGRTLLFRYGHFVRLNETRLLQAERWIQRRGAVAVFVGRWIPGLRTPTSMIAGTFAVPFSQFMLYTTLSAISWCSFWLMMGYLLGQRLAQVAGYFQQGSYLLLGAVLLGAVLLALHQRRRPQP